MSGGCRFIFGTWSGSTPASGAGSSLSTASWVSFGNPYETAHALAGQSRCLDLLGDRAEPRVPKQRPTGSLESSACASASGRPQLRPAGSQRSDRKIPWPPKAQGLL